MSLIKEFAIEPQVMATWAHFNSMWEDFGAGQGRLISKYPVMWKSQVDELAKKHSKPVQATAISAKIRRDELQIPRDRADLPRGTKVGWRTHSPTPRHNRSTRSLLQNGSGAKGVLVAGEFAKDEPPYKVVPEDFIPRSAKDLAACAGLLLANCEQVQFVDPHFNPSEPRFRNTFEAMLQMCDANCLKAIEIHREKPDPFIPNIQEANYRHRLAALLLTGLTLKVFFWQQMPGGLGLHPRFLLTDLGGMHFENGLDEGGTGEKTLVKPLTHEIWRQCLTFYCVKSAAFALTPDCVVTVQGKK